MIAKIFCDRVSFAIATAKTFCGCNHGGIGCNHGGSCNDGGIEWYLNFDEAGGEQIILNFHSLDWRAPTIMGILRNKEGHGELIRVEEIDTDDALNLHINYDEYVVF